MTDPLTSADAERLRTRLTEADDPTTATALHLALEYRRGADVGRLADQYGIDPDRIEDWFRAIEAGESAAIGTEGVEPGDAAKSDARGSERSGAPSSAAGGNEGGEDGTGTSGVEAVVEAAPLALVGLLADGTVVTWNDAAEDLFGWHESEVLGRSAPFLTDESRSEWRTLGERVRSGERVTDVPLRLRTVDGTVVEVSAAAAPLESDGEFAGIAAAFVDVTGRNEREQRLEVLNRVLRHNVRNDLNVILASARQARAASDDDEVGEALERILEVGRSLSAVSEKARDIGSAIEGRHPLEMIDVTAAVEGAVETCRTQHSDADVATDLADGERAYAIAPLPTAIENLLENAVIHNGGDPHVECRVETVRASDGRWVEITVADDGPGIPDQEQAAVLEGSESDLHHGSGLGLWLVNWIVERSNGRLRFGESDLGGAAVTIRLRRADEAI